MLVCPKNTLFFTYFIESCRIQSDDNYETFKVFPILCGLSIRGCDIMSLQIYLMGPL